MTSRNDDMQDAEFEGFLQGKGELASLLQNLPQAQPSAELDAAIIAQAERALAASTPALMVSAANDAIGPEGHGKPPSFLWRWKLPLSLAASILFAIPVVMQYKQESYTTDPVTVASPNAPVSQEQEHSALPQLAQADLAKKTRSAEAAAPAAAANDIPPSVMEASKAKESQGATDARRTSVAKPHSDPRPAVQQTDPIAATAPAPPVMVAVAPEPVRVTITGSNIRRQDMSSAAPVQSIASSAASEEKTVADNQYASNATMRAPMASPSPTKAEAAGMLAKASETEPRSPAAIAAKPVTTVPESAIIADVTGKAKADAAQADKKANMLAAAPAQPAPRPVMAAPPAAAPPLSAALAPEIHLSAHDWSQKIEQLLKNQRNKEALEEWRKFRVSYPDFVVDKSLQKQIDTLQK
ncbi:hypothetical protein ACO0LF_06900 [Undibacterium sp. Di27W]|uniref:hypothetical protein n=1 Tax=Undibacterium sp. Di27W TaxID=3413036 RepID=UPI003BF2D653